MQRPIDIFLSYDRDDKPQVQVIADALKAKGWSVFWDHDIPVGETWHTYIETALLAARCVTVFWSPHAVASRWVRDEAEVGLKRKVLAPVCIGVEPPLGYRQIQCVSIAEWPDSASHPDAELIVVAVKGIIGLPESVTQPQTIQPPTVDVTAPLSASPSPPESRPARRVWNRRAIIAAGAVVTVSVAAGALVKLSSGIPRAPNRRPRFAARRRRFELPTQLSKGFYFNQRSGIIHYVTASGHFLGLSSVAEKNLESWPAASFAALESMDQRRARLDFSSSAFERAVAELIEQKQHVPAIALLKSAVLHDLELQRRSDRKPSFRLYDLFVGLSIRYDQPANLQFLSTALKNAKHGALFAPRLSKWTNANSHWYRGWADKANKKQWSGLPM